MFKALDRLKGLAGGREATGALSGKQLSVGQRVVKVDRLLGEGGFATIYRCTDVHTGETFALKHFLLSGNPEAAHDVDTEVAVMEQLQGCPYVVCLHEAAVVGAPASPTAAFVLMDFCPDTLVTFLQQRAYRLDDATLLRIFLSICRAVEAMHCLQPPLAHRDLKAENVLLGPDGTWVLCDFGSASKRHGVLELARDIALEEEVVRRYTTPAYRAPELYDLYAREYIGPPVDIWALGVLLYLLSYGKLPFEGEAKLQVLNGRYTLPEGRTEPLRGLIRAMLTVSPKERPSIQQVIARVAEIASAEFSQPLPAAHQQKEQVQLVAGSLDGSAAGSSALHERVPIQGWADFVDSQTPSLPASNGSSDSAAAIQRRRSASIGSWATFSPKKAEASAAASAAVAAVSAGRFWSSFGEEMPPEAAVLQQQAPQQTAQQPAQAAQEMQRQPVPAPQQQSVAAAGTAALTSEPLPFSSAAVAQAQLAAEHVEVSPLSAGLARMNLGKSVAKPPATAAASLAVLSTAGNANLGAGPWQNLAGGSDEVAGELETLRQHCAVLEQLLDSRNGEVHRLQMLVEQQAEEIIQLGQRVKQAEQTAQQAKKQQLNGRIIGSTQAPRTVPAGAAPASSGSSSTPDSGRLGKDMCLQVAVSGNGGNWVSFNPGAAGGSGDVPSHTMLQPAGGSFKGSTRQPASSSMSQGEAEGALCAKIDISSDSLASGSSRSFGSGPTAEKPLLPLRSNSSIGMATVCSSDQAPQLCSYPVVLTLGSASLLPQGPRAAPVSTQPSPMQIGSSGQFGSAAANGNRSPMQPSSPIHGRPSGGLGPQRSVSPSKHRRNVTAPDGGFFDDLNPLQ